jgi:hypothetical protein
MGEIDYQILIGALTIIFSGVGAYVGIKVGQAKIERDIVNLRESDKAHDQRISRLEEPYFRQR